MKEISINKHPLYVFSICIFFFLTDCNNLLFKNKSKSIHAATTLDSIYQIIDHYNKILIETPEYVFKFHPLPKDISIYLDSTIHLNITNPISKDVFTFQQALDYYKVHYPEKVKELIDENNYLINYWSKVKSFNIDITKSKDHLFKWAFFRHYKDISMKNVKILYVNNDFCSGSFGYPDADCLMYAHTKSTIYYKGVDNSIDSLLFSRRYSEQDVHISEFITNLLNRSLNYSKLTLTSKEFQKVKNYHLNFSRLTKNELWVNTSLTSDSIYISPKLIRATYITVYNNIKYQFDWLYKNADAIAYLSQNSGLRNIKNEFIENFISSFYFLLEHELAHVCLNINSTDIKSEEMCDEYAIRQLKNDFTFDVFNSMLLASVKAHKSYLWGELDGNGILQRKNRLDSLMKLFKH